MKKIFVLLLVLAPALYGQETPDEYGSTLNTGRAASLGVEASTTFAWDIEKNTTGLETKAGLELIFDLFPAANRGVAPEEDPNTPAVRLLLKDASFVWWNTYSTSGGNYEQDDFNRWQARPLVLTFDTFLADLVWQNYFFRVAGSNTEMQVNKVSLRSIFDDVMDVDDRFYYARSQTRALWHTDRYNIQSFPLLENRLERELIDIDFNSIRHISGILAGGAEFERFGFTLKAASHQRGSDNVHNAWLFGADFEAVPFDHLKIDTTVMAAINYDKVLERENPIAFGTLVEYQVPVTDEIIITPFAGFDFMYDTESGDSGWELGAGLMFYTRGFDTRTSYRILDYDNVIPIGASLGMNINEDSKMNLVMSWFDPAGRDSLIENFGGFLQLEIADLLGQEHDPDFAILAHLEYNIQDKVTPFIRGGYKPEMPTGNTVSGNYEIISALGCYFTPVHFFSLELIYEMKHLLTTDAFEANKGILSTIFTIRM